MIPQWPGVGLVRAELAHLPRREAFTAEHPGAQFTRMGRVHIGHVPYTVDGAERSITIKADSWAAVLKALEAYFDDDEDTG